MSYCKGTHQELIHYLMDEKGIHINRIHAIMNQLETDDITGLISCVTRNKDYDLIRQFNYYMHLFKDSECITRIRQQVDIPLHLIEQLIHFAHVHILLNDYDLLTEMDTLLNLFNQNAYLQLLIESNIIKDDKAMFYTILKKMDRQHIETLFTARDDIYAMIQGLELYEPDQLVSMFGHNDDLAGYLIMVFQTNNNPFYKTLQKIFATKGDSSISKNISLEVFNIFDVNSDKLRLLADRNSKRYAYIVKRVSNLPDYDQVLDNLVHHGALIDQIEKKLIQEIIRNPLMRHVLYKFSTHSFTDNELSGATLF